MTDTMSRAEIHAEFYAHSETYRALYDRYGATLPERAAENLADYYGTTLDALVAWGCIVVEDSGVPTIDIVGCLIS